MMLPLLALVAGLFFGTLFGLWCGAFMAREDLRAAEADVANLRAEVDHLRGAVPPRVIETHGPGSLAATRAEGR